MNSYILIVYKKNIVNILIKIIFHILIINNVIFKIMIYHYNNLLIHINIY